MNRTVFVGRRPSHASVESLPRAAVCRLLWLLFLFAVPPIALAQAAHIDTIVPAQGKPGDTVTVTGNGFGARNVQIAVGGVPAQVLSATGKSASFVVPAHAPVGATSVTVINPGGQTGSIGFRVLLGLTLDLAAATQTTVGPNGGNVTTSSRGFVYTLSIPPGALDSDTSIALTPVLSIDVPFSKGVVAAAEFEPSGLQLHRPATLTIGLPAAPSQSGLLGFLVDNNGLKFEVVSAQLTSDSLTIPVNHFSVGGAGTATIADFAAQITPLLNALPPTLSTSQVAALISDMMSWIDRFGFAVCQQTTLCQQVVAKSIQSLQSNEAAACAQAKLFVAQGEPFLAYGQIESVVRIAARLVELAGLGSQASDGEFDTSFNLTCTSSTLDDIVDLAATQAVQNPAAGVLLLMADIAGDGELLSLPDVTQHATSKLLESVTTILAQGGQQCPVNPDVGEVLINVILQNFVDDFLNALSPGLAQTAHDAFAGCRIRIAPLLPTVTVGKQIQFSGTAVGLTPPVTDLFWSIDGDALGSTIDHATGLFTAGDTDGRVLVKASPIIRPALYKKTTVTIVPETCTAAPAKFAPLARIAAPLALTADCNVQVSVAPSAVSVAPGQVVHFGATVTGSTDTTVSWTATGGTVDANGTFTAGVTPGTYAVTATSSADASKSAQAQVAILGGSISFLFRTIWLKAVPECARTTMAVSDANAVVSTSVGTIENQQSVSGLTIFDFHAPQAATSAILTATDPTNPGAVGVFATAVDPLINSFGIASFGGNTTGLWIIRGDDARVGGPDQYVVNYWNGQLLAGFSMLLKPNGSSFTGTDGVNSIDITISDSADDPNFGLPGFEVNGTAVLGSLQTSVRIRNVRFCVQ
jgi:hypothetical protein